MSGKYSVSDSDIQHYVPPLLTGNIVGLKDETQRPQTLEEIEGQQKKLHDEALKKGHAEGLKQGLEQGKKQIREKSSQLQSVLNFLQQPLKKLDVQVEKQLTELVIVLTKQLFKKAAAIDEKHIHKLVSDSLEYLPVNSRDIQVKLNVQDIELLNQGDIDTNDQSWKCIEDNSITPGGCIIESAASHIDATVENRMQQLVEQINFHQENDSDAAE